MLAYGALPNTAGILIIGDEILSGTFRDENASFLIPELRKKGVSLDRIEFIRDDVAEIADSAVRLASKCTWVFTSGGVGPTHDDVTIAGIAAAFGVDVVRHPRLEELIEGHYGDRATPDHLRLAEVPEGSTLAFGADARWPVIRFENLFILPGVPTLFRRCYQCIEPTLDGVAVVVARAYCKGDETDLAGPLARLARAHEQVAFGSYPRFEETSYSVLVTIEGRLPQAVQAAMQDLQSSFGESVVAIEADFDAKLS